MLRRLIGEHIRLEWRLARPLDRIRADPGVRVQTLKEHPRYKKVIRQSSRFKAHDEQNQCKVGDRVRIMETRPLSHDKRWRVVEIVEKAK